MKQLTKFIPFTMPDIGEEEITEVVSTLRSGWQTTGKKSRQFEADFANFIGHGVKAVSVNSATAGLHLALEAVGVGPGDEVITTPYTFTATAEVIRYLGANPIFVDINPDTYNIDPKLIERAITPRTKAVIPVHFAGLSCEMGRILEIAKKHKLRVIEDAAHALGAKYKDELIGGLQSDATVFSFHATKAVSTGEGGMIVTRDPKISERCKLMRLHGINRDAYDRRGPTKKPWHYEVVAPGYKYNLTDLASSLGIHQLRKAPTFQEKRIEIAAQYDEAFKDLPVTLPPQPQFSDIHAWHLYVLRLNEDAPVLRDRFIELMWEQGVACNVHFIPLHIQPYWRDLYGFKPSDFPNALTNFNASVSLPIFTKMGDSDVIRVIEAVRGALS